MTCTCPENPKENPSDERMYVYGPKAVRRENGNIVHDPSHVYIFNKNCQDHGWSEITQEISV